MGRLRDALHADSGGEGVATLATFATLPAPRPEKSQESQESQGVRIPKTAPRPDAHRARLLALADDELLPTRLVHALPDADVVACAGYNDTELRGYLHALAAAERLDRGLPPLEWGEPVARICKGCGPVLLWHGCPDPVTACPWCFRRKAGKPIARPRERLVARWAREDAENTCGPPYFLPKEKGQ